MSINVCQIFVIYFYIIYFSQIFAKYLSFANVRLHTGEKVNVATFLFRRVMVNK